MQVYDTLTKNLMKPSGVSGEASLSHVQRVAAGCMSGMSACVVVFPLETLRTHAAMGNVKLKGTGAYFRMAAAITRYACCPLSLHALDTPVQPFQHAQSEMSASVIVFPLEDAAAHACGNGQCEA